MTRPNFIASAIELLDAVESIESILNREKRFSEVQRVVKAVKIMRQALNWKKAQRLEQFYICTICGEKFLVQDDIDAHLTKAHLTIISNL